MSYDAAYLKNVVGDILSKGIAMTMIEQPNDPIDALGQWLLRYVEIHEDKKRILEAHRNERANQSNGEERDRIEKEKIVDYENEKRISIEAIKSAVENGTITTINDLWESVVDSVIQWTQVKAVYVGILIPERSNFGNTVLETNGPIADEIPLFANVGDGGFEAKMNENEEMQIDLSKTYFELVAAANDEQKFLIHQTIHRTRTENPETDTIHDPLIFSVIDEGLPYRWIPSCVNEPKIRFLKRFPKIGSCLICPLKSLDGETSSTKAVLICDTLSPPGTGSPIKKDDRDYILRLAQATSESLSLLHPTPEMKKDDRVQWLRSLQTQIDQIHSSEEGSVMGENQDLEMQEQDDESIDIESLSIEIERVDRQLKACALSISKEERVLECIQSNLRSVQEEIRSRLERELYLPWTSLDLIQIAFQLIGKCNPSLIEEDFVLGTHISADASWNQLRNDVFEQLFPTILIFKKSPAIDMKTMADIRAKLEPFRSFDWKTASVFEATLLLFNLQAVKLHRRNAAKETLESNLNKKKALLQQKQKATEAETKQETTESP